MKECSGCRKLIPFGMSRCPDCQSKYDAELSARVRAQKREQNRRYNSKRDPKFKKFYHSSEWKMLSAKVMQEAGYTCAICGRKAGQPLDDGRTVALEVDHIDPIQSQTGWQKRFDRKNLQCLCTDCHNEKHGRFLKHPRGGSKTTGPAGGTVRAACSVQKSPFSSFSKGGAENAKGTGTG